MKIEPLATFLRRSWPTGWTTRAIRSAPNGCAILVLNTPRMARALDEMVEQSRLSERMANSVAVEHLRMRRRP